MKTKNRRYTKEEHEYILSIYKGRPVKETVAMFNEKFNAEVTYSMMKGYLSNRRLKTGAPKGSTKYNSEIVEFVRSNVKKYTDKEIGELVSDKFKIPMNAAAVSNLKVLHGIKSGVKRGLFKKGHTPKNKGLSWDEFMSPEAQARSRKTTFKKNSIPQNRREIGEERKGVDGYWMVKVKDGSKNNNWKAKHHILWESVNGPIPNDKVLLFLDGNTDNIVIENLRLISKRTRAKMAKQGFYTDNPDLTHAGALICEIDNIMRDKSE